MVITITWIPYRQHGAVLLATRLQQLEQHGLLGCPQQHVYGRDDGGQGLQGQVLLRGRQTELQLTLGGEAHKKMATRV
jgi:hypothetical protein